MVIIWTWGLQLKVQDPLPLTYVGVLVVSVWIPMEQRSRLHPIWPRSDEVLHPDGAICEGVDGNRSGAIRQPHCLWQPWQGVYTSIHPVWSYPIWSTEPPQMVEALALPVIAAWQRNTNSKTIHLLNWALKTVTNVHVCASNVVGCQAVGCCTSLERFKSNDWTLVLIRLCAMLSWIQI